MKPTLQPGLRHKAICRATHQRFIVDVAQTEQRLAAKERLA